MPTHDYGMPYSDTYAPPDDTSWDVDEESRRRRRLYDGYLAPEVTASGVAASPSTGTPPDQYGPASGTPGTSSQYETAGGTSRDRAFQEYLEAYKPYRPEGLTEEEQRTFEDLWNQSAEQGWYTGPGYGRSWRDIMESYRPRIRERFEGERERQARAGLDTGDGGGGDSRGASAPAWYQELLNRMVAQDQERVAQNRTRGEALWSTLANRAGQGLNITRHDPVLRAQVDPYAAQEERAMRNYLADVAERSGPYASLEGERRMAAERLGQRVGAFESEVIGRELVARRNEIRDALASMGDLLTADQSRELQRQLGLLDQQIREQGLAVQREGLGLDRTRIGLQHEQFLRDLGLRAEDRSSYWDAVRRGIL